MEIRKHRTHVLRDLAARKNLEFRRSMIGKTLSVVTLEDGALSDNYLKVTLALAARSQSHRRHSHRRTDHADGLCESGAPLHLPPILQRLQIVTSSENSRSLPTGMPIAMRVTFMPSGFSRRDKIDRRRFAFHRGIGRQNDFLALRPRDAVQQALDLQLLRPDAAQRRNRAVAARDRRRERCAWFRSAECCAVLPPRRSASGRDAGRGNRGTAPRR